MADMCCVGFIRLADLERLLATKHRRGKRIRIALHGTEPRQGGLSPYIPDRRLTSDGILLFWGARGYTTFVAAQMHAGFYLFGLCIVIFGGGLVENPLSTTRVWSGGLVGNVLVVSTNSISCR